MEQKVCLKSKTHPRPNHLFTNLVFALVRPQHTDVHVSAHLMPKVVPHVSAQCERHCEREPLPQPSQSNRAAISIMGRGGAHEQCLADLSAATFCTLGQCGVIIWHAAPSFGTRHWHPVIDVLVRGTMRGVIGHSGLDVMVVIESHWSQQRFPRAHTHDQAG